MHPRLLSALATAALLAACATPQSTAPAPAPIDVRTEIPPRGGRCDAAPAQSAIGRTGTARNVEAARVASGALMARTIAPGQMVTKEFDAERLNLSVDAGGKIIRVNCG